MYLITCTCSPLIFLRQAYVENFTAQWDLVGARFRNELPVSPWDAMRYGWESCEALLQDAPSIASMRKPDGDPHTRWDVAVLDGAYPECMLGILHGENVPTIMLNTVIRLSPSRSAAGFYAIFRFPLQLLPVLSP